MKIRFVVLGFFCFLLGSANAQEVPFIKATQLAQWKNSTSDTVLVINFWATWCKPCIAEMPAFEALGEQYRGKNIRFLMVSNDFKKQVDTKLKPFIVEKKLKNEIFYLDENNPNAWIDLIDTGWGGSIPATLVVKGSSGYKWFHEGALNEAELKQIIEPLLQ